MTATVKVFADDFLKRVTRSGAAKPDDDAALQKLSLDYLSRTLLVSGPTGAPVRWSFCGWKRSADLIFICLSGRATSGLPGLNIRDAILADVFADQVNVFQTEYAGQRHSLLFVGGGGVKQLP